MANETKQILLLGAGKSATVLITYLLEKSEHYQWKIVVADADLALALSKIKGHVNGSALSFNVHEADERGKWISRSDLVISMLPPALHYPVALDCVVYGKHLLTASYLDSSIRVLESEINRKGLLFLCEMGLDPGIDHMSAMQLVHGIKSQGGVIRTFRSHCGGLIAPESDDNPWHYKITWNPANVVNAGKTGAVYRRDGQTVEKNYTELFTDNPTVDISGLGRYAYYPNRDSLSYAKLYELETADTFMRTTLRHPDFCKGWRYIVEAGLTDAAAWENTDAIDNIADWLGRSLQQYALPASFNDYIDTVVTGSDRGLVRKQMEYLGLNSRASLPPGLVSSADVMRHLLETHLKMQDKDRDMIVMLHEIDYEKNNQLYSVKSCMIVKGDDALNTAMAKTVGFPLGMAAELILENKINIKGLRIPVARDIYEPVLMKLKEKEIMFEDVSTKSLMTEAK